ncbi:MAG: PrsW family glutamic-type intramembrane protease [Candidatus Gribaldobacteria bacterium]|nr:PrsW family glutamic-type intramembrane protease [Candidatus Gribaldobacteria bacterium]
MFSLNIFFLVPLGLLPSLVWLLFYLRKDKHPESNKMVIKVFLAGALAAFLAIFLEKAAQQVLQNLLAGWLPVIASLGVILIAAVIEETVKYSATFLAAFRNKELDEPIDVMLYLIIAALGFAALENVLVLTKLYPAIYSFKALELTFWRFCSATFLHALCSGTLGYWLAMAFCHRTRKWLYLLIGLSISISLHGVYNWSIMKMSSEAFGPEAMLIPLLILLSLGYLVGCWFRKLKKLKSVCLIK